jgi:hypothetical protein
MSWFGICFIMYIVYQKSLRASLWGQISRSSFGFRPRMVRTKSGLPNYEDDHAHEASRVRYIYDFFFQFTFVWIRREVTNDRVNSAVQAIAHFRYIKYSASLRGCEAVKLNTKEISSLIPFCPLGLSVISLVSASQPRIEVRLLIYRKRPILTDFFNGNTISTKPPLICQ